MDVLNNKTGYKFVVNFYIRGPLDIWPVHMNMILIGYQKDQKLGQMCRKTRLDLCHIIFNVSNRYVLLVAISTQA